jgi:hypothetical protein
VSTAWEFEHAVEVAAGREAAWEFWSNVEKQLVKANEMAALVAE